MAGEGDDELGPDPLAIAQHWLAEAQEAGIEQADAITLATATADGRPSARAVLLKGIDARGFSFYTNYESRKARELDANPRAALVLMWVSLHRQVRVGGTVVKLSAEQSDAYFATRPRGSQLAAWASQQSQPLARRRVLEQRWEALDARYASGPVPRPPHWGGYRVEPDEIELWQGRANRLHDRFAYTLSAAGDWERTRLQP